MAMLTLCCIFSFQCSLRPGSPAEKNNLITLFDSLWKKFVLPPFSATSVGSERLLQIHRSHWFRWKEKFGGVRSVISHVFPAIRWHHSVSSDQSHISEPEPIAPHRINYRLTFDLRARRTDRIPPECKWHSSTWHDDPISGNPTEMPNYRRTLWTPFHRQPFPIAFGV